MNRRGFLTGVIAAPLIIPSAKLEWTNTLIRRPETIKLTLYGTPWDSRDVLRVIDEINRGALRTVRANLTSHKSQHIGS